MSSPPDRPDLDQLRRRARELVRAARSGDASALARIGQVSDAVTLSAARLALAREYGFASWARLKAAVDARTTDVDQRARAFCEASIRDWTGRAVRMLDTTPELARYGFATAVVLGDVARVGDAVARFPGFVTRADPQTGWTPLHLACGSRWHRLDLARADGLASVARLLLDAGADPATRTRDGWTPLRCAVAGAANPAVVGLLLERGAVPDDHDLYLACFGDDDHRSLRLLLARTTDLRDTTALAAPISTGDTEAVRLLLEAGANPNLAAPAELYGAGVDDPPWPTVYAAVHAGCPVELLQLLLDHAADPDTPGPDGRTPYQLAVRLGRADLAQLLRRHGAEPDATEVDLFLAACLRAERAVAERMLQRGLVCLDQLDPEDRAVVIRAANEGRTDAVRLLLDLGLPIDTRGGDGATPLHAAAYSGSADTVRLLLIRGADLEARDSTPLVWAMVGSGERPTDNPDADWVDTVRVLLDAGAPIAEITLSTEDPKPPSPQIAQLLREHGVSEETGDN
ncbi:ankyrin repeat protein [Kribbella aluminosa]|uniref:Ankyrin repeat protein n=1 Tax=Kribbella aluminosa TaxID=416017 RepID=A0ABS4UWX0_9ACTN|nr:ankyrin repeat domain-containing protein [Kribbella aluminosa]MBP2356019.1 ankyrin repeat protein [Kribbella aluminosa]